MRREPNYLLLGAAVAIMLALFFAVLLFLAGGVTWGRTYQTFTVRFPHDLQLPRLKTGAEVECGGTLVGTIESVGLEAAGTQGQAGPPGLFLVVDVRVDQAVGLRKDCRIRAEGPPLGGAGKIVIVHRGHSEQPLARGDVVAGLPPSGFSAVMGTLGDQLARELDEGNPEGLLGRIKGQLDPAAPAALMAKIHAIADDLAATTAQIHAQMDPAGQTALLARLNAALADVQAVTAALRAQADSHDPAAMLGKIHQILSTLGDGTRSAVAMLDENRPSVRATLQNVQETTAAIKGDLVPSVMAQMDPHGPDSLLSKFHTAADRTNDTLANLQEITGGAKTLLTVNQGTIESMLANMLEVSDHLRAASREIRRSPWRLFYRPSPTELKQAELAAAARSFSDAAGKLDSAFERIEGYVRTAGPALPADDPQLQQLQSQLQSSLADLTKAEKQFWESFVGRQAAGP